MRRNFQRYGNLFNAVVQRGQENTTMLVNEPQAIQKILTQDSGKILSAPGEQNQILESLLVRRRFPLGQNAAVQVKRVGRRSPKPVMSPV